MKEIISNIEVLYDYADDTPLYLSPWSHNIYDGYKITTNLNTYYFLISNFNLCCEETGLLSTEDNLIDFIGAELLEINQVDKALEVTSLKITNNFGEQNKSFGKYVHCSFINVQTNKGLFQLTVYNNHNGYYGHTVLFKTNDSVDEDRI